MDTLHKGDDDDDNNNYYYFIQVNSFLVHSNNESTAKWSITETAQQANTDNKGQ
jgi:hypothetical protein